MSQAPPFDRTYWVVPDRLLAGCYPGSEDPDEMERKLENLLDVGVRSVISLMEEDETNRSGRPFVSYIDPLRQLARQRNIEATIKRIPVVDMRVPTRSTMTLILDVLDSALDGRQPVYLHCWGGTGRTGTAVGCFLVRHGLADGEDVFRRLDQLRQAGRGCYDPSPQTEEQRRFVLNWNRHA